MLVWPSRWGSLGMSGKIKQWLNFTKMMLHHFRSPPPECNWHPLVVGTKAKLTFLSSISTSPEPLIEEISSNRLTDEEYCKNQRIHPSSVHLLLKAKSSNSTISSKSLSSHCRRELKKHDKRLKELSKTRSQNWKIPTRCCRGSCKAFQLDNCHFAWELALTPSLLHLT